MKPITAIVTLILSTHATFSDETEESNGTPKPTPPSGPVIVNVTVTNNTTASATTATTAPAPKSAPTPVGPDGPWLGQSPDYFNGIYGSGLKKLSQGAKEAFVYTTQKRRVWIEFIDNKAVCLIFSLPMLGKISDAQRVIFLYGSSGPGEWQDLPESKTKVAESKIPSTESKNRDRNFTFKVGSDAGKVSTLVAAVERSNRKVLIVFSAGWLGNPEDPRLKYTAVQDPRLDGLRNNREFLVFGDPSGLPFIDASGNSIFEHASTAMQQAEEVLIAETSGHPRYSDLDRLLSLSGPLYQTSSEPTMSPSSVESGEEALTAAEKAEREHLEWLRHQKEIQKAILKPIPTPKRLLIREVKTLPAPAPKTTPRPRVTPVPGRTHN